jgi:hypothetical protein
MGPCLSRGGGSGGGSGGGAGASLALATRQAADGGEDYSHLGDPEGVYTAPYAAVTPAAQAASDALWSLTPTGWLFSEYAIRSEHGVDVFVSHVWNDVRYVGQVKPAGPVSALQTYFALKSAGVQKGCELLERRNRFEPITGLGQDKVGWRLWMDHISVNQSNPTMKVHLQNTFNDLISQSRALVVILSPSYFARLWCMFEMASFLAIKDLHSVAVVSWSFMNVAEGPKPYLDALRSFSVAHALCTYEADRPLLAAQARKFFGSEAVFERLGRLCGLAVVLQSLFLSPVVFDAGREKFFLLPLYALAEELGFAPLADAFRAFDPLRKYEQHAGHGGAQSPETNDAYSQLVLAHVKAAVSPIVRAAFRDAHVLVA